LTAPRLVFWHEFASTYSYLSAMRFDALCRDAGIVPVWQPFLLGPIFAAQGWASSPFNLYPAKGRYMWRDMARRAARSGLPPVVRPDPFPQNGLLAARLMTIGASAPWGPGFARAVYTAQFRDGARIDDPALLAALLDRLGEPGEALVARAQSDRAVKDRLRAATEEAAALGLFGAPSFVTDEGELFWGDDRLEDAIAWAKGEHPA
jgi:2-hydroxychromene-2-carboxylate isomerase